MANAPRDTIAVRKARSTLRPQGGTLKLHLIQDVVGVDAQEQPAPAAIVGRRAGLAEALQRRISTEAERLRARQRVEATPEGGVSVVAFELGLNDCRDSLAKLPSGSAFVGGLSVFTREGHEKPHNVTVVAAASQIVELDKCSLSSEDLQLGVQRGSVLTIFLPEDEDNRSVRWAVLNCHEYTHVDLLKLLLDHRIELLVVVTTHAAARLYWEYAVSDVHRLFCYIVIANIAEVGGSGVFAPFRRIGREHNAQIGSAGQVFGARGPARFIVEQDLEIDELRTLRREYEIHGFESKATRAERVERDAVQSSAAGRTPQRAIEPVVPSEHYLHTVDRAAGAPVVTGIREVPYRFVADKLRVAVAQLRSMPFAAYVDSRYRLRHHGDVGPFEDGLGAHLCELEARCRRVHVAPSGSALDMLVLPEVFVPRTCIPTLQAFCDRTGATVVAGVDYPGESDAENANECLILRPKIDQVTYRKITRSQYDAVAGAAVGRMPMARGDSLLRFVDDESGFSFGVLICYDFSHADLIHRLNLSDRTEPLDLVVVVAHNPFGDLYRSCCIADSHRYYQYIVMCNVAEYGGSGVYGPLRTKGARQTLLEMGKGAEAVPWTDIDLAGLRKARRATDQILNDVGAANDLREFMRRPGIFQARA